MDFFGVLTMIGGLAMTLYGMTTMGNGLAKLSGGKLEKVLERLTSNRLMAVLLGAGVTAVIQSSSTTTVMVVGFVNSGIMSLRQTVGIIMGANIGTTITSWLLSLIGIESENFFLNLLKPTSFAPILALVGIVMMMFAKRDKQKDVGNVLVSFAILMFGMSTMSDAVKPLADVPEFTSLMTRFSNPLLGLLAGTLLTGVIQSSAASIGILQALCSTGSITLGVALPIIMGQNIGTCVTALISAIGAKRNAKRAAMIHLYFNLLGTFIFMALFYLLNPLFHFLDLSAVAKVTDIALVHSAFNITATVIMFNMAGLLEKLAMLTIPDAKETNGAEEYEKLDARFLETPGYAVHLCRDVTIQMARLVRQEVELAMGLLQEYDEKKADQVIELEERVDRYEDVLGTYMVKLSRQPMSRQESATLSVMLHSINDFERISDHGVNIRDSAKEMHEKGMVFSEKAVQEMLVFGQAVKDILNLAFEAFEKQDREMASHVEPLEEVIDDLSIRLKDKHIKRLQKGKCTIDLGFVLSDLLNNYERIADHCSNLAVDISQEEYAGYDAHEYLHMVKNVGNDAFRKECQELMMKYQLPGKKSGKDKNRDESL